MHGSGCVSRTRLTARASRNTPSHHPQKHPQPKRQVLARDASAGFLRASASVYKALRLELDVLDNAASRCEVRRGRPIPSRSRSIAAGSPFSPAPHVLARAGTHRDRSGRNSPGTCPLLGAAPRPTSERVRMRAGRHRHGRRPARLLGLPAAATRWVGRSWQRGVMDRVRRPVRHHLGWQGHWPPAGTAAPATSRAGNPRSMDNTNRAGHRSGPRLLARVARRGASDGVLRR